MTPVYQSRFGDHPAGADCFAACLATILDVELADVPAPTVADRETEGTRIDCWARLADYLEEIGLTILQVSGNARLWTPLALAADDSRCVYYVACGPGPRGVDHAVVMGEGDVLAHDPHPDGGGLLEVRDRSYLVVTMTEAPA
jgi:hypothetical protein